MRLTSWLALCAAAVLPLTSIVLAQGPGQEPAHPDIPSLADLLDGLDDGTFDVDDLRRMGLSVFTTPALSTITLPRPACPVL